jgi:hypothetical protein
MTLEHHDRWRGAFVTDRAAGTSAGKWYFHMVNGS